MENAQIDEAKVQKLVSFIQIRLAMEEVETALSVEKVERQIKKQKTEMNKLEIAKAIGIVRDGSQHSILDVTKEEVTQTIEQAVKLDKIDEEKVKRAVFLIKLAEASENTPSAEKVDKRVKQHMANMNSFEKMAACFAAAKELVGSKDE